MVIAERLYMKIINGSIAGPLLAGILALAPATAFSHGGGFGGGGHFGSGGMRAGTPAGFVSGHASGGRGSAFAGRGFHDGFHRHDFRHDHDRFFTGDYDPYYGYDYPYYGPYYGYDYPYYGYDDPYDGYYNDKAGEYSGTIIAVQKELAKLGYYHGPIDGVIGAETRKAISRFQSIDKLSVTGQIDDPTLRALWIS
jgi:hypothetical protein